MSTQNFYCKNCTSVFAFALANDQDEAQLNYDDFCENVIYELEAAGWKTPSTRRGYCAELATAETCLECAGAIMTIEMRALVRSGYYAGACSDLECTVHVDAANCSPWDESEEYDIFNFDITPADVVRGRWTRNPGLDAIHGPRIAAEIRAEVRRLQDQAEEVFRKYCEREMRCVAVFNNGEAMYCDVQTA